MNTKFGKYKSLKRLKDALISNASLNQFDAFRANYQLLDNNIKNGGHNYASSFRNYLMDCAIKNLSKDVVEYLLNEGAQCNYNTCLYECHWNKLDKVYDLINELHNKYGSFTMNSIHMHKGMIINRLIDPEKGHTNKDRIAYVIELVGNGFLDSSEVKDSANKLYNGHKYQGEFKQLTRQLLLDELGI